MEASLDKLKRLPRWSSMLGCLLFVVAVGWLDHLTGDEVPLTILYLPVVVLVCWTVNLRAAVVVSAGCSAVWLIDDVLLGNLWDGNFQKWWITGVHFAFFVALAAVTWRLRLASERERLHAASDSLTGLANSRSFVESSEAELARCRRSGEPLSIAFLDCDDFKTVNDTLGHLVGDELLRSVAATMTDSVRPGDVVARLGGDEFAILMPATTGEKAEATITTLQGNVNGVMRQNGWPVTLSIGVATFTSPPDSADDLIREADHLMYSVKRASKNAARYETVDR